MMSHKFMDTDTTLSQAGASNKSRAIYRVTYSAASGVVRVKTINNNCIFSKSFNVGRGVVQGDIMSPELFILALDQLIQKYDVKGRGYKSGRILL